MFQIFILFLFLFYFSFIFLTFGGINLCGLRVDVCFVCLKSVKGCGCIFQCAWEMKPQPSSVDFAMHEGVTSVVEPSTLVPMQKKVL